MRKRICKKCLSIALSSSLIFSPAFATNEQPVAKENNTKTEEQSGKLSYVKKIFNKLNSKYVTAGTAIAAFVLGNIVYMMEMRRLDEQLTQQYGEGFFNFVTRIANTMRQSTTDQVNRRFVENAEEIRKRQLNEWQDIIHTRKGIKVFEKFFNFVKIDARWRNQHKGTIQKQELIENARTLWPINDQIDDEGRPSAIFADYINSRWHNLNEGQRNLLRNEIEKIKELSEQSNYRKYKEYRDKELAGNDNTWMNWLSSLFGRSRGLSEQEKEEYEELKTKDNEVLGVIEDLVNSHENHCAFRLRSIINNVAISLDSLENANENGSNETATTSDEMKDYAITLFRQRLYDEAIEGSKAASDGKETVMTKERLDAYFGDRFGIDRGTSSISQAWARWDQEKEIRDRIIEKFDLGLLREVISNENNGIFKKFPAESIEGYKNKCMENEVSFKEYCLYANINEADFKAEIDELIDFYQESKEKDKAEGIIEESEGSDPAKVMKEWVSGSTKKLSFNDLKDDVCDLDTLFDFKSKKGTELVDMFPGLAPKNTEKDVANVLMITDMVKNKYFEVDIK